MTLPIYRFEPRPDRIPNRSEVTDLPIQTFRDESVSVRSWGRSGEAQPICDVMAPNRLTRDAPHARADPECPRCKETRTFYAHISPDPQRRGPARVEREAAGWLQSHPCYLTSAHPKRIHTRGAAA